VQEKGEAGRQLARYEVEAGSQIVGRCRGGKTGEQEETQERKNEIQT